ncbi:hypothetical protein ABBQ38_001867 [Trebouxia sp. C0009 RCD-2024]
MVQFQNNLENSRLPEWAPEYVNYSLLKLKLKDIIAVKDNKELEQVFQARKFIFQGTLDTEIEKVLSFYADIATSVKQELQAGEESFSHFQEAVMDSEELDPIHKLRRLDSKTEELKSVALRITNLLQYVSLNMQAIRKILKKFAKHVEPTKPAPGFLALEIQHPHEPGWKMMQGTFLPANVSQQLDDMTSHATLKRAADKVKQQYAQLRTWRGQLLKRSAEDLADAVAHQDLAVEIENILASMDVMGSLAQRNAMLVHGLDWSERRAGIFEPAPTDDLAVATTLGLVLNCLSSGLYMANYQLVLPNIRDYLTDIGAVVSMAGVVIGCCDIASIPGTIGYSVWTNSSFKAPLISSAIACILGNTLYCIGYDCKWLSVLMAARLLTGLGSARTVNRRYIADFVRKAARTKASAAFVTCSAAGMALGPLLAVPMSRVPTTHFGPFTFNAITAGAYVMSLIWLVFLAVTLFFFTEPPVRADALDHSKDSIPESTLRQPLLSESSTTGDLENGQMSGPNSDGLKSPVKSRTEPMIPSWQSTVQPMIATFCILFLLKLVQQAYLDSLPLFSGRLYGWTSSQAGLMLAVFGLTVIPVNTAVGQISDRVSDRGLNAVTLLITAVGCGLLMCGGRPVWMYFLGGTLVFMCTVILEGSGMSLMSKIMHPSLARGTWNAGLMSTEAGTLGRLTGNLCLSIVSRFTGVDTVSEVYQFGFVLFALMGALTVSNLGYMLAIWKRLAA